MASKRLFPDLFVLSSHQVGLALLLTLIIGLMWGWLARSWLGSSRLAEQYVVSSSLPAAVSPSLYLCRGDIDGNGHVNVLDLVTVVGSWGKCPVLPTPQPTCQPRPACLDAIPSCLLPEPAGGWCPGDSPGPTPLCGNQHCETGEADWINNNCPPGAACSPSYTGTCPQDCSPVGKGEVCAGKANIPCTEGLTCYVDPNQPVCMCVNCDCSYPKGVCIDSTMAGCQVGGCSNQLCYDPKLTPGGGMVSTCEWKEEYACYQKAECGRSAVGKCEWKLTDELKACLGNPSGSLQ